MLPLGEDNNANEHLAVKRRRIHENTADASIMVVGVPLSAKTGPLFSKKMAPGGNGIQASLEASAVVLW